MSIIKYRPMGMSKTFDDFFDNFFNRGLGEMMGADNFLSAPSVNIRDEEDQYTLEMAAPGLSKEDFSIEIDKGYLVVSAEKEVSNEENDDNRKYTRREFNYTRFSRSFQLPDTVNEEAIEAKYNDGILSIHLPKVEEAKKLPAKSIEIQ